MTPEPVPKPPRPPRRRTQRWPLLLLAMTLAVAVVTLVERPSRVRQPQNPSAEESYDPMAELGSGSQEMLSLLSDQSLKPERVLLPRGAVELPTIPAELPAYPGARPLMSFQRRLGNWVEQDGSWTIPGADAAAVLGFYEHAARAAGFKALPASPGSTRLFQRGEQVLLVRITPQSAGRPGVRLTLIFRYTDSSPRPGPSRAPEVNTP